MFGWIGQLAAALASNPAAMQVALGVAIHLPRAYERLSPASKAKVEAVIRWGVERTARYALNTVLGEVGDRVIDQVADREVADFAKAVVKRGVTIGVDAALKEVRG